MVTWSNQWERKFAYIPRRVYPADTEPHRDKRPYWYRYYKERWIWWQPYERMAYDYWYPDCSGTDYVRREILQEDEEEARPMMNRAFEEWKVSEIKRIEETGKDFIEYLQKLRMAKDRAEFDQFLSQRTV